jgi:hypothetical protein
MTTERQKQANRRNATQSTGPRSKSGKERSRINAFKHGFSVSIARAPAMISKIADVANAIADRADDPFRNEIAAIAAEAELELHRVRALKGKLTMRLLTAGHPYRP